MDKLITAITTNTNPALAVMELYEKLQISTQSIKAVTFYASAKYAPDALMQAFNTVFINLPVFGCTTKAGIYNGSFYTDSIVAMAFTDKMIEDVKIVLVETPSLSD